jgi:tetratricopeptide (TPR) repeat protein
MKKTKNYLLFPLLAFAFTFGACKDDKKEKEAGAGAGKITDIPVTSKSKEAIASFQEGIALADDGSAIKARAAFAKAIGQDSTLAIAYLFRGAFSQSNEEFMNDMAMAKSHLDGASDWEKMYYDYQNTFVTDDWNKRLEVAQKIVAAYPDAARAQADLGNTYAGNNQNDKAREAYQKAIELDPKWSGGYNALSGSYIFSDPKDLKKGEENALKVVELLPKSSNAEVLLGDCYRAQNDMEKARTAYTKAIELNTDEPTAYYKRGHVNSFLGKYDEARQDYMEGAKHDDDNTGAMLNIAYTYLYAGDHATAMKTLMDNAAKLDASGASKSKIAGQKMNYFETCAAICLHDGDVAHLKELISMMQGPSEQRGNDIGSPEAKLTEKANLLSWQSLAAAAEGKLDDAKAKAEEMKTTLQSINNPTKLWNYESSMGYISMKEKKYADAIGHYEKANPNDFYNKYWLAMANEAAGNKDKANSLYKEIAAYNFNDVGNALIRNEVKKKVTTP